MSDMLHCIGCGCPVAENMPGQTLAISCSCGALSPLLYVPGRGMASMPWSLCRSLAGIGKPHHIENYLGYSDHTSPEKDAALAILKQVGATLQADCPEAKCREESARHRRRYQEAVGRQARILEVGEP